MGDVERDLGGLNQGVAVSTDGRSAALRAEPLAASQAEPAATNAWRCFHCDDLFTSERDAQLHFGRDEGFTPACVIKGADGGLLRALRDAEEQADEAIQLMHAESTDAARAYHRQCSRHNQALIAAEELGFERGMTAQAASVERLRRILHRYGGRIQMSMCHRADWQQEIDEALRFVADNPEALPCDSGSDRNGEDAAQTAAECEASQSGAATDSASPKDTPHDQ